MKTEHISTTSGKKATFTLITRKPLPDSELKRIYSTVLRALEAVRDNDFDQVPSYKDWLKQDTKEIQ